MIRTVEAVIDEHGNVRLLEPVHLPEVRRALVTILEECPGGGVSESALLSEAALAKDWNRSEEDEAWSHLGAQSHVLVSFDIPEYTGEVTGLGTVRLLEAIRETGLTPKFYQASSSEMFGKV